MKMTGEDKESYQWPVFIFIEYIFNLIMRLYSWDWVFMRKTRPKKRSQTHIIETIYPL